VNIKIRQAPIGEAPDWVKEAWIGLSLPLASTGIRKWHGLGVLSGPSRWFSELWAIAFGRSIQVTGYLVNAKVAVDCLSKHSPEAAAWWREHTPHLLSGRRCFIFDADACEREP
jgi:hypothetical protein